jgi:hypothetical protein
MVLRYTRKRPMYENGRRPCMDLSTLRKNISCTPEAWRKISMTDKVYQKCSSVARDDGLQIQGKLP